MLRVESKAEGAYNRRDCTLYANSRDSISRGTTKKNWCTEIRETL